MTAPVTNLTAMFAVPFASLALEHAARLNPGLAALFAPRATDAYRDRLTPGDRLCFRGQEDLFDWPEAAELRAEMLGGLCAAVMAANTFTEAEFDAFSVQARARLIVVRPDGALPASSLPLATWCALYCVAAPAPNPARPDSASLRLYESRLGNMLLDASNWRLRPPFSPGHTLWRPAPGEMAVFPAWILHEVTLNRGESDLMLVLARARFARPGMEALPPW